jgi:hypothetical protein
VCCDYANCLESDCRTYQNSLLLCDWSRICFLSLSLIFIFILILILIRL